MTLIEIAQEILSRGNPKPQFRGAEWGFDPGVQAVGMAVFGGLEGFRLLSEFLEPDDLTLNHGVQALYILMSEMSDKDEDWDPVTLDQRCVKKFRRAYAQEIEAETKGAWSLCTPMVYKHYARRELLQMLLRRRMGQERYEEADAIKAELDQKEISIPTQAESVSGFLQRWTDSDGPEFKTGLNEMDSILGGMARGELIIVYGDSSHGKSITMHSLMLRSLVEGRRVMIADYEMGTDLIQSRIASMVSGVRLDRIVNKTLDEAEKVRFAQTLDTQVGYNLLIAEGPAMADLKAAVKNYKPDILLLDYIQLLGASAMNRKDSLATTITILMSELKNLALSEKLCVIVGSQVVKDYGAGRPRLQDIKESGAIVNSADKVLCAYWPYKKGKTQNESIYVIGVDKNKSGPTGVKTLQIQPWCVKLINPMVPFNHAELEEAHE